MTFVRVFLLFLVTIGISAITSVKAQDENTVTTTTTRVVVTSPVPPVKEVVTTPPGFANCFTVAAGYYNNIWVSERQVCQYTNTPGKVAWISGYWGCSEYTPAGVCTNWSWVPSHWSDSLTVY